MLTVIPGIKPTKIDYFNIYNNAFISCIRKIVDAPRDDNTMTQQERKQVIFYGVKMLNAGRAKSVSLKEAESTFGLMSYVKDLIKALTPNEFENIFPIAKEYDGDRFGTKDYFFTKNIIEKHGADVKIGESVNEFLWDYHNWEVGEFLINTMTTVDDLRRFQGEKGTLEEFFEEKGIPTYTLHEGDKGKKLLVNNQTGEEVEVKNKRPRYLKVIK